MVHKEVFGKLQDKDVYIYRLKNKNGMTVEILSFGATVYSVSVPDRSGKFDDVTLGYPTLEGYASLIDNPNFGIIAGRVCNRIAKGKFTLDGKDYTLDVNNGENHLHGGAVGFGRVHWEEEKCGDGDGSYFVTLRLLSPDGDGGYPGNLNVLCTYTLTDQNELIVDLKATTDRPTPVNLTNHAYWDLGGHQAGSILDHVLTLEADRFLTVDAGLIPDGRLFPVAGTPLDFTTPHVVGTRIPNLGSLGYDHCFILREKKENEMSIAATVYHPHSGRELTISTTQPAIQFYSGNFLNGMKGKEAAGYPMYGGLCLETQGYVDAINQPSFPSVVVRPQEVYHHTTIHKFSVRQQ